MKVGQELWFVRERFRGGEKAHPVIVTAVGRKYAKIKRKDSDWQEYKMLLDTMVVIQGNYTVGLCYISKEEYDKRMRSIELRADLRRLLDSNNAIPLENLQKAHALLTEL